MNIPFPQRYDKIFNWQAAPMKILRLPWRQEGAVGQIVLVVGVDKEHTTFFDCVDNRFGECLRQGGASEAPSQASGRSGDVGIGICGTMHHDGALFGLVVNSFFQPVQHQGVTVASLISVFGQVKAKRTFVRTVFIGE